MENGNERPNNVEFIIDERIVDLYYTENGIYAITSFPFSQLYPGMHFITGKNLHCTFYITILN